MKDYADKVIELSWKMGEDGDVNRNVLKEIYKQEAHNGYYQSVAGSTLVEKMFFCRMQIH